MVLHSKRNLTKKMMTFTELYLPNMVMNTTKFFCPNKTLTTLASLWLLPLY